MVILACAIVSRQNGKTLISRQFVEMTRSRIEGLLIAFITLIPKDKQHTFIETDDVRYVYQPLMDKLYCVLITTKTSNILEDLETLRLFVRVINEHAPNQGKPSDEQAIFDNAFTLIFAFDEIVNPLGYRESVNVSQVRTFIEMDSHEERVHTAVRQTQEREAKQKMREKAKELSKLQRTQQLQRSMGSSMLTSNSSSNFDKPEPVVGDRATSAISSSSNTSANIKRPKGPSRSLKLGSKKNQNLFSGNEDQLVSELNEEDGSKGVFVSEKKDISTPELD